MISLELLLDRLEVTVEPFIDSDPAGRPWRMRGRIARSLVRIGGGRTGILPLAGGACLRIARRSVAIVPPARAITPAGPGAGPPAKGRMRATFGGTIGLFDHLPASLVEKVHPGDPLAAAFAELLEEVDGRGPGTRALLETLLRRCLILFLRRHCEKGKSLAWLAPIGDGGIGRALAAMQERPEQPFTLDRLSALAGMSRSVFAAHFRNAVDQPPMTFLKGLRLDRAIQLLTRTDLPVKVVAARAGYSSRSSFTRAFLTRHGAAPAAFRAAAAARRSTEEMLRADRRSMKLEVGKRVDATTGGRLQSGYDRRDDRLLRR